MREFGLTPERANSLIVRTEPMTIRDLLVRLTNENDVRSAEARTYHYDVDGGCYVSDQQACFVGHMLRRIATERYGQWQHFQLPGNATAAMAVHNQLKEQGQIPFGYSAIEQFMDTVIGWNDDGKLATDAERKAYLGLSAEIRTRSGVDGLFATIAIEGR